MIDKKIAATWCRVSTHDQRELSLDSQEVAVRQVLEGQGYQVPEQFILKVDWSSMDLMSCPQFQDLRRWIVEGKVQAVGTLDRDRLQARGLQRLIFLSDCQDYGAQIVTVQGAPMLEGGEGQLVELGPRPGEGEVRIESPAGRSGRDAGPGTLERSTSQHAQGLRDEMGRQPAGTG